MPELVLGHLLTGSNFDDSKEAVTGGRHGYGAKLTNIFSTSFEVETVDSRAGLRYRQQWRDNMKVCDPPVIEPSLGVKDFTRITFVPDVKGASPRLPVRAALDCHVSPSALRAVCASQVLAAPGSRLALLK